MRAPFRTCSWRSAVAVLASGAVLSMSALSGGVAPAFAKPGDHSDPGIPVIPTPEVVIPEAPQQAPAEQAPEEAPAGAEGAAGAAQDRGTAPAGGACARDRGPGPTAATRARTSGARTAQEGLAARRRRPEGRRPQGRPAEGRRAGR